MTSIRRSILAPTCTTVIVVAALALSLVYGIASRNAVRQFDQQLRTRAESIASMINIDEGKLEFDYSTESREEYGKSKTHAYYQINRVDGKVLFQSANLQDQHLEESAPGKIVDAVLPSGAAAHQITINRKIADEGEDEKSPAKLEFNTTVAVSTAQLNHFLFELSAALVGSFFAVVVPMVILLPVLISRGLRPLNELSSHVSQINPQTLHTDLAPQTLPQELQPIALKLNQSMQRLADAFHRERQFSGNAAHELRTPIAAIRTNAEVALKWPDVEQLKQSMISILTTSIQMHSLVSRLLDLTRLSEGAVPLQLRPVSITELIEKIIAVHESDLNDKRLKIEKSLGEISVTTDRDILHQLLENLIVNSIRHSPKDSVLKIDAASRNSKILISIENPAADLEPDDLRQMFAPFWTKSTHRTQPGTGLGLSLSQEYARVISATIHPNLTDDHKLIMNVILPEKPIAN